MDLGGSSEMSVDADTGAAMLRLHEETHSTLHVRILEARGLRPREGRLPLHCWGMFVKVPLPKPTCPVGVVSLGAICRRP